MGVADRIYDLLREIDELNLSIVSIADVWGIKFSSKPIDSMSCYYGYTRHEEGKATQSFTLITILLSS